MQTKTLIQTQANVVKLTSLNKGNVVKIIDQTYSSPEIKYSVVLDILNSGEKTYVQFLQYTKSYETISAEIKTYAGDKDIALFPASLKEVEVDFKRVINKMVENIKEAEKAINDKKTALQKAKEFISGELSKTLTEASFTEISQADYDKQRKIEAGEIQNLGV